VTAKDVDQVKTGTITTKTTYEKFAEYCQDRADLDGQFVIDELQEKQMAAILAARSEEELDEAMKAAGLTALKDLEDGTEIQINSYHLMRGTRDEFKTRLGVFAVLDAQLLSDGTRIALDTSIDRIIGFLRAVESGQINGVDFPLARRVKKTPTGRGDMITLLPIPKRAVQA
jgi:hypothetical protein